MVYARFLVRRLLQAIPVVFGVTIVVFLLIHLVPGDPARTALGTHATPQAVAQLHHLWGLDKSLPEQYWLFLKRLLGGDLGTSLRFQQPAGHLVLERMPVTLWLLCYATVLTCLIAVPAALLAASRQGALRDRIVRLLSVTALGIPGFWLGLMLIEYIAVETGIFPSSGYGSGFLGHLESLFLPSLTIAAGIVPLVVRSLRAETLKVADADFVTTARAKGLTERRIRLRHVLRNALAPSITVLAVNVSFLVGGTLVIEQVFSLGGVGSLMLQGIDARDFPIVQAVTLILALVVVGVNIFGDLVQALIDPRVEVR
ncbi:MAG: ABC transporter permease [Actinobacteria bacterium]|nr:ABC transporter permease [Actinomycetota bacterium]